MSITPEMDMCIYLCQNMGAMNRPLRLAECFVVFSWVNVGCLRSVSWLFRGWMLGVYRVFRGYFVGVRCIINNPFAAKWQAVSSRRGRFIVPVYTCSPHIRKTLGHICNPFETHLCNVRNVFVICVLHIRRVKVWFLRCKSMVFGVQKLPFWLTKTTFLTCKKWVFVYS